MRVSLPIADPTPDGADVPGVERTYEPGESSVTQGIVERVMAQDFPAVAAMGIEGYVHRLSRIVYTDGFQVKSFIAHAKEPAIRCQNLHP